MAYDEYLGERIAQIFKCRNVNFFSKKMMGGLCFMVNDKMCCGIHIDKKSGQSLLMARIGDMAYEAALQKEHSLPMDFTGKPMKGYIFVQEKGIDFDQDLEYWIDQCLAFNPIAKASKKK